MSCIQKGPRDSANSAVSHLFRSDVLIVASVLFASFSTHVAATDAEPPASTTVVREPRARPDFLDADSPQGLRVVQISTTPEMASHHIYPESHMFTPDSTRFIFHRMGVDDSSRGVFWLCDIEDNFGLRPLTTEEGAKGPAVTPDGKWMYYFVDKTLAPEKVLKLKRVSLQSFQRETLLVLTGPIPGTNDEPTRIYPVSSMSSDGKRLCTSAFLGDGKTENAPFGLLVFDLEDPSVEIVFAEREYCNMHPQYCRSLDSVLLHDILVQHNHGCLYDLTGSIWEVVPSKDHPGKKYRLTGKGGADLHVIRDDGTNWRDVPIARDGVFTHTGHEQWRGRMGTVISSVTNLATRRNHLFESWPIRTDETTSHKGSKILGARNNELTRELGFTDFNHFSMDLSGTHIVARQERQHKNDNLKIYIGTFSPGENAFLKVQYLLDTKYVKHGAGRDRGQADKPRPFFSPDGKTVLFHSDCDGQSQIFMATGYEFPQFVQDR